MMNFRLIVASLIKILADSSNNCFRVVGAQTMGRAAEETLGDLRLINVFHRAGQPQRESSAYAAGPIQELDSFQIEFTVTGDVKIDLDVLDNLSATPFEIANALETAKLAASVANDSLDELMELVLQILMDPRNRDMGMSRGIVGNRWITERRKDDPVEHGEFVVLTGVLVLTLLVEEQITGAPVLGTGSINKITLDGVGDNVEQTSVKVNS